MSGFSFITGKAESAKQELPMFQEYAWDFEHDCFIYTNGNHVIVKGREALKVWIYKTLKTERYRYLAYEHNCGAELEQFFGRSPNDEESAMEVKRYVTEALLVNPYITSLNDIEFTNEKDILEMSMKVQSVYGEVDLDV